jgi:hypothetical protein
MSKKVLWCGGSHLASASNVIKSASNQFKIDSSFYITAGGKVASWSIKGGQYKVIDPHRLKGYRDERLSLSEEVDLSGYDAVVFLGQYVQPSRVFSDKNFDWNQPLSDLFINDLSRYSFEYAPHPTFNKVVKNEAPKLFKKICKTDCRFVIFADPFVHENSFDESNSEYVNKVPSNIKHIYYQEFCEWYSKLGFKPLIQPNHTFNISSMATKLEYILSHKDDWHMNEEFWKMVIFNTIIPELKLNRLDVG